METTYITSAAKPHQLPDWDRPEIALIGRSNVGKSTLLNALLGRRQLARTSRTPGHTRMVNFFSVGEDMVVADLPGYGFSKAAKDQARTWQPLMDAYVRRANIRTFLFLLDCRRDLNEEDAGLLQWLASLQDVTVVLTKADKLSRQALKRKETETGRRLAELLPAPPELRAVSCTKKTGLEELRRSLFGKTSWS